jgi:uncharacterized membrane protein
MRVVVFDSEGKAYADRKARWALDAEGSISVYASSVVVRNSDGSSEVKQEDPGLAPWRSILVAPWRAV